MKTKNKIPMRQCTGCREMKSKKEMLRVLKTTEDEIVLDTTGKKNGRGAYLCLSRECLDKAIKNHGLERIYGKRERGIYSGSTFQWKYCLCTDSAGSSIPAGIQFALYTMCGGYRFDQT